LESHGEPWKQVEGNSTHAASPLARLGAI